MGSAFRGAESVGDGKTHISVGDMVLRLQKAQVPAEGSQLLLPQAGIILDRQIKLGNMVKTNDLMKNSLQSRETQGTIVLPMIKR